MENAKKQRFRELLNFLVLSNYCKNQEEFSKLTGINRTSLSLMMTGSREISRSTLLKIKDIFNEVNIDYIETGEGELIDKNKLQNGYSDLDKDDIIGILIDEIIEHRKLLQKSIDHNNTLISILKKEWM